VDRSGRQGRRAGKSDPLNAVSAARAAQSARARGAAKGRDGAVEAFPGYATRVALRELGRRAEFLDRQFERLSGTRPRAPV
jgi:hypothetical protein